MASKVNKKLRVEEFYARRAEVQELVDNGVIPQDIMDGAMEAVAQESDLLGIVDIPLNQLQPSNSSKRTITILPADSNMKPILSIRTLCDSS